MNKKAYVLLVTFCLALGSVFAQQSRPEISVLSSRPDVVAPDSVSLTTRISDINSLNDVSSISVLLGLYGSRYSIPVSVSGGLYNMENYPVNLEVDWAQVYKDLGAVNEHIDPFSVRVVDGNGYLVPSSHTGFLGFWEDMKDITDWNLWAIYNLNSGDYNFNSSEHYATLAMNADQPEAPEYFGIVRTDLSIPTSAFRYAEYKIKVGADVTMEVHFREGNKHGFPEVVYYYNSTDAGSWTIIREDLQEDFKKAWPYTSGYVTINTIEILLNEYNGKTMQTSMVNGLKNASIEWVRLVSNSGSITWLTKIRPENIERFHISFDSLEEQREPVAPGLDTSAIERAGITSAIVVNIGTPTHHPRLKWDGSTFLEEYDPDNMMVLNPTGSFSKEIDNTTVDFTFDFTVNTNFPEGAIDVFVTVTDSNNIKYMKNFEDVFYAWTEYPRVHQLISSVRSYIGEASQTAFLSPEAKSLLQRAEYEYQLGLQQYETRNLKTATQHLENAIDYVNQAYLEESAFRNRLMTMSTYIIVAVIMVPLTILIIKRRRKNR